MGKEGCGPRMGCLPINASGSGAHHEGRVIWTWYMSPAWGMGGCTYTPFPSVAFGPPVLNLAGSNHLPPLPPARAAAAAHVPHMTATRTLLAARPSSILVAMMVEALAATWPVPGCSSLITVCRDGRRGGRRPRGVAPSLCVGDCYPRPPRQGARRGCQKELRRNVVSAQLLGMSPAARAPPPRTPGVAHLEANCGDLAVCVLGFGRGRTARLAAGRHHLLTQLPDHVLGAGVGYLANQVAKAGQRSMTTRGGGAERVRGCCPRSVGATAAA